MSDNQQLGSRGESLARDHLVSKGYEIVTTNYQTRRGEIDIIARQGRQLLFVEVKYRTDLTQGHPAEAITRAKLRKFRKAVQEYLASEECPSYSELKFDAICILEKLGEPLLLEHIENMLGP